MRTSPPPTVSWQSPEPEVGPAPGVAFAPHDERLIAYIIDSVIACVIVIALVVVGSVALYSGSTVVDGQVTSVNSGAGTAFGLTLLVALIIGLLYFPFFWVRGGQTPGMRAFGLRVVRDADGSRIGWGRPSSACWARGCPRSSSTSAISGSSSTSVGAAGMTSSLGPWSSRKAKETSLVS